MAYPPTGTGAAGPFDAAADATPPQRSTERDPVSDMRYSAERDFADSPGVEGAIVEKQAQKMSPKQI